MLVLWIQRKGSFFFYIPTPQGGAVALFLRLETHHHTDVFARSVSSSQPTNKLSAQMKAKVR